MGTYDGATVRLYVGGIEVGSGTDAWLADIGYDLEHSDLHLGAYVTSADHCGYDFRFQGDVDEVQVYGRALSAEEIAVIYAAAQ